jgi:dephospho-CoA kinase
MGGSLCLMTAPITVEINQMQIKGKINLRKSFSMIVLLELSFPDHFPIMSLMKVAAIVGMTGSGKSEVARVFEESGFFRIRFGDITDEEVKKRGLVLNEANERRVRELLRKEYGMAAYAELNLPRIDAARQRSPVVVDGLYSWEEYLLLKEHYGVDFYVVAVWASPQMRYARLAARPVRPLTAEEAASRDRAEIENLKKGGPIAMADFTILNESTREELKKPVQSVIARIGGNN